MNTRINYENLARSEVSCRNMYVYSRPTNEFIDYALNVVLFTGGNKSRGRNPIGQFGKKRLFFTRTFFILFVAYTNYNSLHNSLIYKLCIRVIKIILMYVFRKTL